MRFMESSEINIKEYHGTGPCIYFLLKDEEVIYVGQTKTDLGYRLYKHAHKKSFDRVTYFPCKLTELNDLENKYIEKYQPKLNIVGPLKRSVKWVSYRRRFSQPCQ